MDQTEFSVFTGGRPATLVADAEGLELGAGPSRRDCQWGDVRRVAPRDERTLVLSFAQDRPIQLAFSTPQERDAFLAFAQAAMSTALRADPPQRAAERGGEVPLLTVSVVPGRDVIGVGGLVTAHSVMSRDLLSDVGSDFKSVVGGSLKGMERAVGTAISAARRDLSAAAVDLDCDCVIGVTVSIAGLGDKAQGVVMSGTAVRTVAAAGPPIEPESSRP